MSASAASADAPQPPIPPLRLSGLEPLVIDEHSLFVNVGERTNVSGSKAFDVQWLIELLQAQGVPIVISQRPAFVH
ncbi:hypothetical protein [Ottowia massiliensis]|jgi:methionine synthase|uniref:hypothetical protein n=1 Tax=Ottowia massiliensis TaxID=2045302 RepID=UPI000C85D592|nr:hypothetical protein [Ottowia massiliensis]